MEGNGDLLFGTACSLVAFNLTAGWLFASLIAGILKRDWYDTVGLGIFFGPIGWLLIGFLPQKFDRYCEECGGGLPDPPRKRCPHCGELLAPPRDSTRPMPLRPAADSTAGEAAARDFRRRRARPPRPAAASAAGRTSPASAPISPVISTRPDT